MFGLELFRRTNEVGKGREACSQHRLERKNEKIIALHEIFSSHGSLEAVNSHTDIILAYLSETELNISLISLSLHY